MVKNIPTIERSTKIRFGRNTLEDQAENTIVFNASNESLNANTANTIYIAPIRLRADYTDPNIVLLMYNKVTKEVTESGEAATDIIETTLQGAAIRGNVINVSTVYFNNTSHNSIVTDSNVGIVNTNPLHTLSVGSNLYVNDTGSNVLVVVGGVSISGNLDVKGGITAITSNNLIIEDAIIELGKNNTSGDTTLDLGLIMSRPGSNVTIGFREETDEIVLGFTESSAYSNAIVPLTSENINVHVYGRLYTEANVGVLNTNPMHTLDVGSNLYVDEFGSNILVVTGNTNITGDLTVSTDTLFVDSSANKVGIKTTSPSANLHVVGNVYISSNLTVDDDTFHVDSTTNSVGIETKTPSANLHVVGNVYVSSNLTVDTDTFHVDVVNDSIGIGTVNPSANLHVVGNVYVSSNLTVDGDTFHVDSTTNSVGIETKTPSANLHVVGNVYISSNLTVDTETLHVDAGASHVGVNTKTPHANLHVVGNVYVSSNLTVDTDTFHVDVVSDSVGVGTVTPHANLHVVGNVYVSSNLTVDTDTFHVDVVNDSIGVGTKNPSANLHVVGNVYVSSNLTVDTDTFHVDVVNDSIGVGTKTPSANLHIVGNVYVSSNLTVDGDTFHVDVVNDSIGVGTKTPTSNLHVVGNVYVTSNTTTDGTLTLNHPTTAILTDLNSNVEIKLNQMANVTIDTTTLSSDHVLAYDGQDWTNEYPIHTFIKIKNDAGVTISRGDLVYVKGAQNQNVMQVGLARADDPATMPCIGVVYDETLTQGSEGVAVAYGRAQSVDTSGFLTGETVYVSNVTAGGLSNVKPFYTDSVPNLIQNIGVVAKIGETTGTVFVTGIGRANDVPNAQIVFDEGDINWVYVSDVNNDFQKIEPSNLLTQLQTLQQVTDTGNATSNTIRFTNATTGLVTTSNLNVGSNISVIGLTDPVNKYLPMVNTDGFFQKSPVYLTPGGKYVISASEAEFLGNITLSGNTYILNSESVTISDRILGIAANNSATSLDTGIIIEHKDAGTYANVGLIFHADEHRFSIGFTQNTFTDNHILHYQDPGGLIVDLRGNVLIQNSATLSSILDVTGAVTFANDFTVGAVSNLFVDVSTSRVGINEASPTVSLDVGGDARVQSTTDTVSTTGGALVVLGGLGVASNIHSTNVYVGSHVGVGTVSTTHPVHVMATTTGGVYVNGNGNDARLTLEPSETTKDPVISFNTSGENFSVGIDNSINDTFNIANHATDVGTNVRVAVTPAGNVGIGLVAPSANLHVVGNVYVTSNLTVDTNTLHVDAENNRVGILTKNPEYALDVHGTANVGTLITTNLYGPIAGANTAAVTSLTASGMVQGATLAGTNIYGTLAGANTAVVTTLTATDIYGTLAGANTAAVTSLTASGMVQGATLAGTNIYGTLAGANTAVVTTLTATDIYGTLAGANTAAVTSLTASGMVQGATISGTNVYGTLAGSNAATITTLNASGVVTLTDATESTSATTGALKAAGGVGITGNVYVGERAYVTGGLITNTGQVTKKTYSFTGVLDNLQTIANSTIKITFSAHVFYAKIVAHLIEGDDEVSTLSLECGGGHRTGGTPLVIAKGPTSVFGNTSTNPWNIAVAVTTTTVALAPTTNMVGAGNYNVFIEYISAHADGAVTNIIEGSTTQITFGY